MNMKPRCFSSIFHLYLYRVLEVVNCTLASLPSCILFGTNRGRWTLGACFLTVARYVYANSDRNRISNGNGSSTCFWMRVLCQGHVRLQCGGEEYCLKQSCIDRALVIIFVQQSVVTDYCIFSSFYCGTVCTSLVVCRSVTKK
jgi:hypothetical protein